MSHWIERLLARMGTPAGASISVDIAALKTALDALGLQYVEGSVSDAGPAATDFDTDLAEATDNHYNGALLMFTDGDCAGQAHVIDDYDGAAKNVSFSAEDRWTEAPGDGDNFIILPSTGTMAKAIYTSLGTHDTDIKALLATIAGYLDTEIAAIITSQGRQLFTMDFWSETLESVTLTDTTPAGTDVALPDVAVDIPAGATVVRAVAMFKFRMLDNPDAANALQGDQYIGIQKGGGGGYANAIFLDDNMFGIAEATREGGDIVVGNLNVVAKVDGDATYNLQWTASLVDVANLKFCDVQTGIRIWYSV